MSKAKHQTGSAIIIVIIVIVIGLFGVGGYFVWQNFFNEPTPADIQPDEVDTEANPVETEVPAVTPTITPATTTTPAATTADDGYYHISQWGIKGKYNGSYGVQYEIRKISEPQNLEFSSSDFISESCKNATNEINLIVRLEDLPSASIATIKQISEFEGVSGEFYKVLYNEAGSELIYKHVGNYYYSINFNTHHSCTTPGTADALIEASLRASIKNLFATLVAE